VSLIYSMRLCLINREVPLVYWGKQLNLFGQKRGGLQAVFVRVKLEKT